MSQNGTMGYTQRGHKPRHKRFRDNAKSFGRKGIYGRGTGISDEQYIYYINILKLLNKSFANKEEKGNFTTNIFNKFLIESFT